VSEQALFDLYSWIVVALLAQSAIAWELGFKGIRRLIDETNANRRPSALVLTAFGCFLAGGIWERASKLVSPFTSWRDCWPTLVALTVYVIGRYQRV
jgi:hypothetical protein